jgi:hypothetical protein
VPTYFVYEAFAWPEYNRKYQTEKFYTVLLVIRLQARFQLYRRPMVMLNNSLKMQPQQLTKEFSEG